MVQHQNQRKDMQRKTNKRTAYSPRVTYQSDSNYRLDRQLTKEAQHLPILQAPIEVPNFLYSRGAQTLQHKNG